MVTRILKLTREYIIIPPPDPPPPSKKCRCSYWFEKGGDGKRDWKRWWDCVFGDGPKKCK
jgi:hypothetical protein